MSISNSKFLLFYSYSFIFFFRRKKLFQFYFSTLFPFNFEICLKEKVISLSRSISYHSWKQKPKHAFKKKMSTLTSHDVITRGGGLRARSCPGCVCVRSPLVCAEKQEEMPLPVQVFNFQVKLFRIYFYKEFIWLKMHRLVNVEGFKHLLRLWWYHFNSSCLESFSTTNRPCFFFFVASISFGRHANR